MVCWLSGEIRQAALTKRLATTNHRLSYEGKSTADDSWSWRITFSRRLAQRFLPDKSSMISCGWKASTASFPPPQLISLGLSGTTKSLGERIRKEQPPASCTKYRRLVFSILSRFPVYFWLGFLFSNTGPKEENKSPPKDREIPGRRGSLFHFPEGRNQLVKMRSRDLAWP